MSHDRIACWDIQGREHQQIQSIRKTGGGRGEELGLINNLLFYMNYLIK